VLLVYFGTDVIAAWGLNLQYGVAGVLNFGYIAAVAIGAYMFGALTLGPDSGNGGYQSYIIGLHLTPALGFLGAALSGCIFGGVIGLLGMRRLRPDYQAIVLLVVAVVALTVVQADTGLFNGNSGLSLIPNPVGLTGPATGNGWFYVAIVFGACIVCYRVLRRFTDGPLGRSLRALRDDDVAAAAIGKNVVALRILVQIVGGGFGALAGALLVGFIGAWSPSAWQFAESLSLLTAIIVGGYANNVGVIAGALLVPVIFQQATQYVPGLASNAELATDIGWMATAVLTIGFIWWRPGGIIAERRPRYGSGVRSRSRFSYAPLAMAPATVKERAPGSTPSDVGTAHEFTRPAVVAKGPSTTSTTSHDERAGSSSDEQSGRALLQVSDLAINFGGVRALESVTLEVAAGTITGLIGPNGAGKSTLVNCVSGFSKPDSGSVMFNGHDITRAPAYRSSRLGLVRTFQLSRQFSRLTAIENLLVARQHHPAESVLGVVAGLRYWKGAEEETVIRARGLLEMFEMTAKADELASNLSGGERRMIELMRALMTDPVLLVLDEPLAGLSPRWSERFEEAVRLLRESGITFLLIEHDLGIVERLCESVVVMARGRVLSTGSMSELRTRAEVQAAYVIG